MAITRINKKKTDQAPLPKELWQIVTDYLPSNEFKIEIETLINRMSRSSRDPNENARKYGCVPCKEMAYPTCCFAYDVAQAEGCQSGEDFCRSACLSTVCLLPGTLCTIIAGITTPCCLIVGCVKDYNIASNDRYLMNGITTLGLFKHQENEDKRKLGPPAQKMDEEKKHGVKN